jgi:dCMP deaminase
MSMFVRIPKEEAYLRMAVAMSQRSTCLDKQVGCVITNIHNIVIATGYNGAPRGHIHCIDCHTCWKDLYGNPSKCPSAHAEQNALLQCKNINDIHTVYLTLSPCIVCIRMLMNTTCQRIVFINEHRHPEPKEMWVNAGKEWIQYGI